MEILDSLNYSKEHEWVKKEDGQVRVGITDHAQKELGDIVFVELPSVGKKVKQGEPFMIIESVKSVSDVYAPLTGEIVEVNESLDQNPEKINESPYEDGWIILLKIEKEEEIDALLSAQDYKDIIE